jgi:hypothetical protein
MVVSMMKTINPFYKPVAPSYWNMFVKFRDTGLGQFKTIKGISEILCKLPLHLSEKFSIVFNSRLVKTLGEMDQAIGDATKVTGITKWIGSVSDCKEAVSELFSSAYTKTNACAEKVLEKVSMLTADSLYVGSFVAGCAGIVAAPAVFATANVADIIENGIDLKRHVSTVINGSPKPRIWQPFSKIYASEKRNEALIAIVKRVTSITSSVLKLVALFALGFTLAYAGTMLTLSVVNIVASFWQHFYHETMLETLRAKI